MAQHVIDHLDQPVVEVARRIAQVLIRLLKPRIEAHVKRDERLRVYGRTRGMLVDEGGRGAQWRDWRKQLLEN